MSTAIPPMPVEAEAHLSEPARIINVYFSPSKTFADIRRNASWWVPWLLLTLVGLGVSSVMVRKVDYYQMTRQQIENSRQAEQFQSLPKEQQEQRLAVAAKIGKIFSFIIPIIGPILGALVIGALMMGTFNFLFETEVAFRQAMAIVFYAWLPGLLYQIFTGVTLLLRTDTQDLNLRNILATNPAYFMDVNSGSKFLYGMAASLDIFSIWIIILIGMGFAVVANNRKRLSTGTAIATVAAWFLAIRLTVSALGWV